MHPAVIVSLLATLVILGCLQAWRIHMMVQADMGFEKDKNGEKQKGRSRNRWDYSSAPALQRMAMRVDPKLALATVVLACLTAVWYITRESAFLDLAKVNFGALLGTLITKNEPEGTAPA